MARSFFKSTFGFVSDLFTSRNASGQSESASTIDLTDGGFRSNRNTISESRKRKAIEDSDEEDDFTPSSKRRRLFKSRPDFIPYADDDSSVVSPSNFPRQSATAQAKAERDRVLMPPPATPKQVDKSYRARDDDAISFVSTAMTKRKVEDMDEDQMEEARRLAAAITLPANSGAWSETEQELFFHLAYRGFEPLLPQNWMIDFDTLPLSIFAHEESTDSPLVQNMRDNQFRAAHALRRLLEAGHDVRDRTHVSPGVRREKILERIVKRYLHWALTDVGLRPNSMSNYQPTHVVVTHRKGRSTLQTLEEMASKLHALAERHRKAPKIFESIEAHESQLSFSSEADAVDDPNSIPTLIGIVIISSVLAIVTLSPFANAHTASTNAPRTQTASPPISDPGPATGIDLDCLRTITDLDFSQRDQDVWNALGIAIVAMQIRKEALKANAVGLVDDAWDRASFVTSRFGDDDLESRMGDVDDPDL